MPNTAPDGAGVIHVAAAALVDGQGRVLLARRHPDAHQGDLWEFPGGKCEPGETMHQALARELREELGVEPVEHRPLIRVTHHYADRSVLLDVHRVERWQGEPHGREGQPLAWVEIGALDDYPMPAADGPIVRALQLPDRYLITPAAVESDGRFLRQLQCALDEGVRLLQLRVFDVPETRWLQLARQVLERCRASDAQVLFNVAAERLVRLRADGLAVEGLHLSSRQLRALDGRPDGIRYLAASCHDENDLQRAVDLGADFALLSPVLPTRSHPDAEPLGWERFAAMVDRANLPVYALGGMQPASIPRAWQAGAQGVAGIRGL